MSEENNIKTNNSNGFKSDDNNKINIPKKLSGVMLFNILLFLSIFMAVFIISTKKEEAIIFPTSPKPSIAVITLKGLIMWDLAESMQSLFEMLEKDKKIVGLVIKINSGGGAVGASQEISDIIEHYKTKTGNPVYSHCGDVAASGAYWIACHTDKIIAQRGSTIGSIGVIMQGISFQGLMEQLGIKDMTVKSGEFKDTGTYFRDMSENEKKYLQGQINSIYKQFFDVVLKKRKKKNKLDKNKLKKLATGRIFTGAKSLKHGLIDELGSYNHTIDLMKKNIVKSGKVENVNQIEIIKYSEKPSLKKLLEYLQGGSFKNEILYQILDSLKLDKSVDKNQIENIISKMKQNENKLQTEYLNNIPLLYYSPSISNKSIEKASR